MNGSRRAAECLGTGSRSRWLRLVRLDSATVVESWIRQSREPVFGEDLSQPVTATGVVLDVWAEENGTWRLAARHPQRASD